MELSIQHEEHAGRGAFFIIQDRRRIAEMTYRRTDVSLATIDHTLVDPALRGQGVARLLLDGAVAWARANQIKFTSTCSYATAQFVLDRSIRDVVV